MNKTRPTDVIGSDKKAKSQQKEIINEKDHPINQNVINSKNENK